VDYSSCSNTALSLPLISIFPNPLNQSGTNIEEPEIYHDSKGDIAE